MSTIITYDKDNKKVPSREFLSTVIILLRKCEVEVEMGFVEWLQSFGDLDDKSLRSAIYKILKENYLDQEEQQAN